MSRSYALPWPPPWILHKPVVLMGCGGHGMVVLDALWRSDRKIVLGCDPGPVRDVGLVMVAEPPRGAILANGIGDVATRAALTARYRAQGYGFATVIHPAAEIAHDVEIGDGAQILAGAIVQPGCRIGRDAIVNIGARVCHHTSVGPGAHIGPGAILCGGVTVGAETLIGAGAVVTPGIRIGAHQTVKAGARLSSDLGHGKADPV